MISVVEDGIGNRFPVKISFRHHLPEFKTVNFVEGRVRGTIRQGETECILWGQFPLDDPEYSPVKLMARDEVFYTSKKYREVLIAIGFSWLVPPDQYVKETGRQRALRNALEVAKQLTGESRQKLWDAYAFRLRGEPARKYHEARAKAKAEAAAATALTSVKTALGIA